MHVISQTVYKRGAPSALWLLLSTPPFQLPLRPSHSPALHVHTVYSHINRVNQTGAQTQASVHAHTHTHIQGVEIHIFTHTKATKPYMKFCIVGLYSDNHMHETPHTDSYVNTAANTLRRLQQQQQKTRTSVHLHGKVHELHETFHVIPLPHILM